MQKRWKNSRDLRSNKISNSSHSDSEELVDAVSNSKELVYAVSNTEELFGAVSDPKSDPSSNPKLATYTTNGNSPQRLLANRKIPEIIQGVILPVHQVTADGVLTCGGALHVVRTVLSEEIVTVAAPRAANVFKDHTVVNWKVERRPIPINMNTIGLSPKATIQVMTGTGTSSPPICKRIQEIGSPRGSIGPQKVRNDHPFKTSINRFSPEHGHPTPIFSKVIVRKTVPQRKRWHLRAQKDGLRE